jgi:hypothetical protein
MSVNQRKNGTNKIYGTKRMAIKLETDEGISIFVNVFEKGNAE